MEFVFDNEFQLLSSLNFETKNSVQEVTSGNPKNTISKVIFSNGPGKYTLNRMSTNKYSVKYQIQNYLEYKDGGVEIGFFNGKIKFIKSQDEEMKYEDGFLLVYNPETDGYDYFELINMEY